LVLKEFFRTDYRGIMEILADSSDLQTAVELEEVPHYTTLQKAAKRFTNKKAIDRLLRTTLALATTTRVMKKSVALSAIDSTGLESHYTSSYFVTRKAKGGEYHQTTHYTTFPKVGIVMDRALPHGDRHLTSFTSRRHSSTLQRRRTSSASLPMRGTMLSMHTCSRVKFCISKVLFPTESDDRP
jgi:hypothetical protein